MTETRKIALQTKVAERLNERVKEIAPRVAERMRPVLGNVPVSKDERRRRWWQVADDWPTDPEGDRARQLALLESGMTRQDVGLLKYKYREIDMKAAGDGDDDRKMAEYAREMTALGPPAPDPLEAAALAARPPVAPVAAPESPIIPALTREDIAAALPDATGMIEEGGSYG